ncbi:30830_t:CDS:2, partial [Gigaspora margarita]
QGEAIEKTFIVEIEKDKTIIHLKKGIKKEREIFYRNIDANDLTIWKVNIPANNGNVKVNVVLENNQEKGVQKLDCPVNKIGDIFKETPATDHIHIIVVQPAQTNKPVQPTQTIQPVQTVQEVQSCKMAKKYSEAVEKLHQAFENGVENFEDLINDVEKYRKLACYEETLAESNDISQNYSNYNYNEDVEINDSHDKPIVNSDDDLSNQDTELNHTTLVYEGLEYTEQGDYSNAILTLSTEGSEVKAFQPLY